MFMWPPFRARALCSLKSIYIYIYTRKLDDYSYYSSYYSSYSRALSRARKVPPESQRFKCFPGELETPSSQWTLILSTRHIVCSHADAYSMPIYPLHLLQNFTLSYHQYIFHKHINRYICNCTYTLTLTLTLICVGNYQFILICRIECNYIIGMLNCCLYTQRCVQLKYIHTYIIFVFVCG